MPRPARATSRRGSTASPICSSIWCSRAPAAARRARSSEAIEDVGGDLNACTERDGTSFTASLLAEHLPLGHRTDRRHGPAPAFRRRRSGAREGGRAPGTGRGARHAVRHHLRRSLDAPPSPTSRSAARCSATRRASPRSRVDDLHAWRDELYRAGSLILVAAGKVDHDALVALAERAFRRPARRRDRRRRRRPASPAATASGRRARRPGASRLGLCRRPACATRIIIAARLFSDIVGGGTSSRLFQAGARGARPRLFDLVVARSPIADAGLFYRLCRDGAARGGRGAAHWSREVLAATAADAQPSASSSGRAPRPRPAC